MSIVDALLASDFREILPMGNLEVIHGLPLDLVVSRCPSIGATTKMPHLSSRYNSMCTAEVLHGLLQSGWLIFKATQQTVRKEERRGFQRHQVVLYHPRILLDNLPAVLEHRSYPLLYVTNSHDGLNAWEIDNGLYRLVCCNGLVSTGFKMQSRLRHGRSMFEAISMTQEAEQVAQSLFDTIRRMKLSQLSTWEMNSIAERAINARWSPDDPMRDLDLKRFLLSSRRPEDDGTDAWVVLNRIQENLISGGWSYSRLKNFEHQPSRLVQRTARPLKELRRQLAANKEIWGATWEVIQAQSLSAVA